MINNAQLAAIVEKVADALALRLRDTNDKCCGCDRIRDAFRDLATGIGAADRNSDDAVLVPSTYATVEFRADSGTIADADDALYRAEAHAVVLRFLLRHRLSHDAEVMGLTPWADFEWDKANMLLRPVPRYVRMSLQSLGWTVYVGTDQPACLRAKRAPK